MRAVKPLLPARSGVHDGLAWWLHLPVGGGAPGGGVVLLHGADSSAESHRDFARACAHGGLAALAFDARGHGHSGGALDGRAVDDVARMADLLRAEVDPALAVALRGSSLGGWLALAAAGPARARAVVAICPASSEGLRRGLAEGRFGFAADRPVLERLLADTSIDAAVRERSWPLLLLHAEGDERVPVERSRALAALGGDTKYVELPGGHHRSVQHDAELQGVAVRWLARALRRPGDEPRTSERR